MWICQGINVEFSRGTIQASRQYQGSDEKVFIMRKGCFVNVSRKCKRVVEDKLQYKISPKLYTSKNKNKKGHHTYFFMFYGRPHFMKKDHTVVFKKF